MNSPNERNTSSNDIRSWFYDTLLNDHNSSLPCSPNATNLSFSLLSPLPMSPNQTIGGRNMRDILISKISPSIFSPHKKSRIMSNISNQDDNFMNNKIDLDNHFREVDDHIPKIDFSSILNIIQPIDVSESSNSISLSQVQSKPILCKCKKSKCLKLYCDCFQALKYCDVECNCVDCHNDKNHEGIRQDAVKLTKEKNESAFKVKICKDIGQHFSGCNCKQSKCLKKYCECFHASTFCGINCKCSNCSNYNGSKQLEEVILFALKPSAILMSDFKKVSSGHQYSANRLTSKSKSNKIIDTKLNSTENKKVSPSGITSLPDILSPNDEIRSQFNSHSSIQQRLLSSIINNSQDENRHNINLHRINSKVTASTFNHSLSRVTSLNPTSLEAEVDHNLNNSFYNLHNESIFDNLEQKNRNRSLSISSVPSTMCDRNNRVVNTNFVQDILQSHKIHKSESALKSNNNSLINNKSDLPISKQFQISHPQPHTLDSNSQDFAIEELSSELNLDSDEENDITLECNLSIANDISRQCSKSKSCLNISQSSNLSSVSLNFSKDSRVEKHNGSISLKAINQLASKQTDPILNCKIMLNINHTEFDDPRSSVSFNRLPELKSILISSPSRCEDDSGMLRKQNYKYKDKCQYLYNFFGDQHPPQSKVVALLCLSYLSGKDFYSLSITSSLWCMAALDDALWQYED